jgi:glutamate-1-semialdehyde 2,1-aminomutase
MNIYAQPVLQVSERAKERIVAEFRRRTPRSAELHREASTLLPGGINRNIVHLDPYPVFVRAAQGAFVVDEDGNRYLDCIGNYTAMAIGHSHAAVIAAVEEQVKLGTAWAAASACEAKLAAMIAQRMPSVERIRFTASGTEATMMAIRAARAHTGRSLVAKIEGGYHGLHDYAVISMAPALDSAGPATAPHSVAPAGIPKGVAESVIVLPFNDLAAARNILVPHAADLACILLEPIPGVAGVLAPEASYLKGLRALAAELGCLLVFDEVISFRVAYGGAQEMYGVKADLTTLGKIIGGGFPIGAVGGRADVMEVFAPGPSGAKVVLSGTFHANPVALAAGMATLTAFDRAAIAALNRQAASVFEEIRALLRQHNMSAQLNAVGSLFNLHLRPEPVRNYRDAQQGSKEFLKYLYLALLNEGVMLSPRGMGALSTAMSEKETGFFLNAFGTALNELRSA